jgi:glycosyltransferase involved in cell wall biosynthesis
MQILSKKNRILWVNYHGTRRPEWSGRDIRGVLSALRRATGGLSTISETMSQLTPLVLPGARRAWSRSIGARLLKLQIESGLRNMLGDSPLPIQVWSFAPDVPELVGALGEECFIYYCVDDYTMFKCHDMAQIATSEGELLRRADLTITTSQVLHDAKRRVCPDAKLVRHGVDFEHFSRAWRESLDIPSDVRSIPRPVFGFFGLIQHWIDVELIASVAKLRPLYAFVLIGDAKADLSPLRHLPNVYGLGRRDYATLPAYAAKFSAGLLPFVANEMTRNVNPVKLHEYLAAGLPVVSTDLPEARRYAGAVFFGETAQKFAEACDAALAFGNRESRLCIAQRVAEESWESRVELVSTLIADRVERKQAQPIPTVVGEVTAPLNLITCPVNVVRLPANHDASVSVGTVNELAELELAG